MKGASDLEDFAGRHPHLFPGILFAFTLILRLLLLGISSSLVGTSARNLSFFYDGLSYIYISKTFPWAYTAPVPGFPILYKPIVFTVWFPTYPLLIRLADFLFRDSRISAIAVSQLAASAATVLFFRLAKTATARPAFASLLFCLFPPTWLLAGSLALVEPVYLLLFIASLSYYRSGELKKSAAFTAAAILAQKSGFLLLPILLIAELWTNGPSRIRRLAPFILSPLPLILLQIHLCVHYGDPWATLDVMRAANNGESFLLPFQSFIHGLLSSQQWFHGSLWLRKAELVFSASFYLAVFGAAWRRRAKLDRGLITWLGVILLFNSCLGGTSGYFPYPRYMLVAAPAALLLLMELIPAGWTQRPKLWAALALIWIPIAMAVDINEITASVELILRMWPRGYFQLLLRYFS